jgi:hypothetical protein
MVKARPLPKASRKSGGKATKRPSRTESAAKPAAAKAPSHAAAAGVRSKQVSGGGRKVAATPRSAERQVVVPETPPPLPSPIASFTF